MCILRSGAWFAGALAKGSEFGANRVKSLFLKSYMKKYNTIV